MVSAPACHRVLVSMAPSVACAIKVSSALPEAWAEQPGVPESYRDGGKSLDRAGPEISA